MTFAWHSPSVCTVPGPLAVAGDHDWNRVEEGWRGGWRLIQSGMKSFGEFQGHSQKMVVLCFFLYYRKIITVIPTSWSIVMLFNFLYKSQLLGNTNIFSVLNIKSFGKYIKHLLKVMIQCDFWSLYTKAHILPPSNFNQTATSSTKPSTLFIWLIY